MLPAARQREVIIDIR